MNYTELADRFMAMLVLGDEDDIDAAADALIYFWADELRELNGEDE